MKYQIYYSPSPGEDSHSLLRSALGIPDTTEILKVPGGKPFIHGGPDFSISHTSGLWAVATGAAPCGLDVQLQDERNWEAIARRMFSQEDVNYAMSKGALGFFQLWSRYEAIAKYTGQGIFNCKPVLTDGTKLLSWVKLESGETAYVADLDGRDFGDEKYQAALCTREPVEIEIRRLDE